MWNNSCSQLSFSLQKEPGDCPACDIQHRAACKIWCETFSDGKMSFDKSVVSNISSVPVEFNHHLGNLFFGRNFCNWQDVSSMGFKWNSSYLWATKWGKCSAEKSQEQWFSVSLCQSGIIFLECWKTAAPLISSWSVTSRVSTKSSLGCQQQKAAAS